MKIKLTYIGRRYRNGRLYYAFVDDKDETFLYPKVHYPVIGFQYEAERKEESLMLSRKPQPLDTPRAKQELLRQWEAEEMANIALHAEEKAVKKLSENRELNKLL